MPAAGDDATLSRAETDAAFGSLVGEHVPKPSRAFPTDNQTMYDTTLGWRLVNPRMEELGHTDSLRMTAENLAQERFEITPDEDAPERMAEEYRVSR